MWARDKPHALPHVGDITWGLYQHEPELASPKRTQIFERDGAPVAFGILWLPQTLQSAVHPEHRDDAVYDALLEWFQGAAGEELDGGLDAQLLESDEVFAASLRRHGFAPLEGADWFEHRVRSLVAPVESAQLPDGYRLRNVAGESTSSAGSTSIAPPSTRPRSRCPGTGTCGRCRPTARSSISSSRRPTAASPPTRSSGSTRRTASASSSRSEPTRHTSGSGSARRCASRRAAAFGTAGADTAVVYSVHGYHAGRLYASAGFECVDRQLEYRLTAPAVCILTSAFTRCLTP